jgi:iron complex transport system ATP-binding protein
LALPIFSISFSAIALPWAADMYTARAVSVAVRGKTLLDQVDLRLDPGKVVAIVGPNGAGKSTLIKVMAGERRADRGRIELDGRPLEELPAAYLATRRAVLPQSIDVVFPFLVSEVVSFGVRADVTTREREELVARALDAVELTSLGARVYGTLSGGEKQRAQLARVLAQVWSRECTYLLLDEPTSSLDLAHQLVILRLAREHAANGGGVLMVLHDLNLASMAADEIVALKDGSRVAAGDPGAVITDDLIAALYGVRAEVRGIPSGPFLLPQTAHLPV